MNLKIVIWLIVFFLYCLAIFGILLSLRKKVRAGYDPSFLGLFTGRAPQPQAEEDPFGIAEADIQENARNLEFNFLIRAIVLFLILSFAYFYNGFEFKSYGVDLGQINDKTQELVLKRDKERFFFMANRERTIPMKIIGVQVNPFKKELRQLSLITHILVAAPVDKASRDIFDQHICEMKYHDQLTVVQVISATKDVKEKIDRFSRERGVRCVNLMAVPLELKRQYQDGRLQAAMQIDPGGDYQYDLNKFLAVTDFETAICP